VNAASLLGLPQLDADLCRLEETLRAAVGAEDPFLDEVARHLVDAGGKRLRPALTLAAAAVGCEPPGEEVLLGGVAVELVHLASLYHDDVMDEAATRRDVESVNARYGNLVAIVAGDFLLARSAAIAASLGTEASTLLASTLGRMCEGQVAEVRSAYDPGRDEAAYLAAIAGKTASLMAAACRIGAITAGLPPAFVEALTELGECFGMVFQIRDDILDVVGDADALGKPPGQDLVEGVYTLPVLRALADPGIGPRLRSLLGRRLERETADEVRRMVAASPGVAEAAREARRWADRVAAAAAPIADRPAGRALGGLGHAILDTLPV
jgi:heptaprenyl diphosphate synthase